MSEQLKNSIVELTFSADEPTTKTILGEILKAVDELGLEEASAFTVKYRSGRIVVITGEDSPELYDENGVELEYDDEKIESIQRVESANAGIK